MTTTPRGPLDNEITTERTVPTRLPAAAAPTANGTDRGFSDGDLTAPTNVTSLDDDHADAVGAIADGTRS